MSKGYITRNEGLAELRAEYTLSDFQSEAVSTILWYSRRVFWTLKVFQVDTVIFFVIYVLQLEIIVYTSALNTSVLTDLLFIPICTLSTVFKAKTICLENTGKSSYFLDWRVFKLKTGNLNEEDKSVLLAIFLCWICDDYNLYFVMIRS